VSLEKPEMVEQNGELFPIRTVAALTGVNPITLRAWERRYGLIKPVRTPKGHRLYTTDDIERIHRVVALLERGIPVGQVRGSLHTDSAKTTRGAEDTWAEQRRRMITAIACFDERALEDIYTEALALYPTDLVTRMLLLPLLTELGRRWESTEGSVAEEHFFGVYLRNKLGARFHHRPRGNTGPRLLVACLPGEMHEIGLLLFALAAHDRGYRLVLLGANMPLDELALSAKRARADAIVLSGSVSPETDLLGDPLRRVCTGAAVPVFVGGQTSATHHDEVVRAGAVPLGSDIEQGLRLLGDHLATAQ